MNDRCRCRGDWFGDQYHETICAKHRVSAQVEDVIKLTAQEEAVLTNYKLLLAQILELYSKGHITETGLDRLKRIISAKT